MKRYSNNLLFFFIVSSVFIYGVGVGKYNWFPHSLLKQLKFHITIHSDKYNRLIWSSEHIEIECPPQKNSMGVIVAFGQSNSANHAEYKVPKSELGNVVNYFRGKCFEAQSPLIGATGEDGEWISMTAKKLIDEGIYEKVMVVSSGIGGSRIERWAEGNDLNTMLVDLIKELSINYNITDMIWHQGEADILNTHSIVYEEYFSSMLKSIRKAGVTAPIFLSIASICGNEDMWTYPNRVTKAQIALTKLKGVELGVNTDELVPVNLRYDKCHFVKQGQQIAANDLAKKIAAYHKSK